MSRLSFNSMTADRWSLPEVIDACAEHGIEWIGPWRHKLAETGVDEAARRIADAGLKVSSLCRGGFFAAEGADEDNRRAVEEAAALGTDALVLVCGPPADRDLAAARALIERGIERLLPYADEHGVRLGIEPLHPMMIGERSAIVTLEEALDVAERIGHPGVGVVIDVYHTFWDPRLAEQVARAAGRIVGYHVNDWLRATSHTLLERGMMGDGIIDLAGFSALVEAAGYTGPIEVEILNPAIWDLPHAELMSTVVERFDRCVL
ncbi:MAG TPA: sugar phosphate isomerase/epimerase family protein [Solirubrobacter sp.]|nr:sugar phosphate isomerase/epimerase family protein [Solirubrobacter sp.]